MGHGPCVRFEEGTKARGTGAPRWEGRVPWEGLAVALEAGVGPEMEAAVAQLLPEEPREDVGEVLPAVLVVRWGPVPVLGPPGPRPGPPSENGQNKGWHTEM